MPFSFLNMAFLAGLAAAAIPIVIHLFSRKRQKRVEFSSLQFIEEIAKRRVRRVTITQWLILALRVLVLTLVALALMRPALKGDFALGKSKGESSVALILDRSFSLRAATDTGLLFDEAKRRAVEVAEAIDDGDEIHFLGATPGLETPAPPFHDRLRLKEEIQALEPGWGNTDLVEAIREAGTRLRQSEALNHELYIVSDFQKSGFGDLAGNAGTQIADLVAKDVRVYLLPLSEETIDNRAIESVSFEGIPPNRNARALVANHGGKSDPDVVITLSQAGRVMGEGRVSVDAGSSNTAIVPILEETGALGSGEARLDADRLAADDVRFFAAEGGRAFRILVVDGARPGEEAAPFLPLALSPEAGVGRFVTDVQSAANLGAVDLTPYQMVALANVERINSETIGRLRAWQEAGGRVLLALGDRVDLRHYNEAVLPALMPGVRLLDLRGDLRDGSTFYTLTPRVAGHPAFAGFKATPGEPLSGAQFWRIVAVEAQSDTRVLAEFGPGLPAIVETPSAALIASSVDGRWNNFPTHGAFLPLVHQLVHTLAGGDEKSGALVGQPIEHVVDEAAVPTGANLVAEGPDGLQLAVISKKSNQGLLLTSEPVPAPGLYRLKAGEAVLAELPVNVDTKESDLEPLDTAGLKALFPGRTVRIITPREVVTETIRESRYGREFWREFLLAALVLLGLEAFLARRGGA